MLSMHGYLEDMDMNEKYFELYSGQEEAELNYKSEAERTFFTFYW